MSYIIIIITFFLLYLFTMKHRLRRRLILILCKLLLRVIAFQPLPTTWTALPTFIHDLHMYFGVRAYLYILAHEDREEEVFLGL